MNFKYMEPILYGIYFSFCARKGLHYVVFLPKLMFDPLFAKFSQENKKIMKTRYILKKPVKIIILWL